MNESSSDVSHSCLSNPSGGKPYKARVLVQPFGSRRAPSNWGMVVTFFQFVARELLFLTLGAFAGDVYGVEPAMTAGVGFGAVKQLGAISGFNTSKKDGPPPGIRMVLLGADVPLRENFAQADSRPDRITKLKGYIAQALRKNSLDPSSAIKLRGKLGFYASLLTGEPGRGAMGPLIRRQYNQTNNWNRSCRMSLFGT